MDREQRGQGREYLAEQRRAADDPRPDPDETDEQDGGCPWCRRFCPGPPDVLTGDDPEDAGKKLGCFSRFLGLMPDDAGQEPSDE